MTVPFLLCWAAWNFIGDPATSLVFFALMLCWYGLAVLARTGYRRLRVM